MEEKEKEDEVELQTNFQREYKLCSFYASLFLFSVKGEFLFPFIT